MTYYQKYAVAVYWLDGVCRCYIYHPTEEDLLHDGDNYVCRGGAEGMHLDIYDDLETALVKAAYHPKHIKFTLNNKSLRMVKNILKRYKWDNQLGLVLKDGK